MKNVGCNQVGAASSFASYLINAGRTLFKVYTLGKQSLGQDLNLWYKNVFLENLCYIVPEEPNEWMTMPSVVVLCVR